MNINIVGDTEFLSQYVSDMQGFEFPSTRVVLDDLPSRDGALFIGARFGSRPMSWKGLIKEPDVQEKRRELISACSVGELKTLEFETCDGIPVEAYVEVLDLVAPYKYNRCIYLVQVVAPDPRFFSQTETVKFTGITVDDGGTPIPTAIPTPIPGGSNLSFSVVNSGSYYATPTFSVRGPGTNFSIKNLTNGQQLLLNLTLTDNQTVIINTALKTAYLGTQNVFGSVVGDWITLVPGNNILAFNAGAGITANTRLTVSFKSAFLGI